jgi:hypothetical protein
MPSLLSVSCNLYESRRTILDLYQGGDVFWEIVLGWDLKEV